jgi:hypothetical protein
MKSIQMFLEAPIVVKITAWKEIIVNQGIIGMILEELHFQGDNLLPSIKVSFMVTIFLATILSIKQ